MAALEIKSTWHGTRSRLVIGMTWEARVTSATTAETRGVAPAMSWVRRCADRRRASQRSRKGSAPGKAEASKGRRLRSTRWTEGNAAKSPAKWSASAADTVGRTVTMEQRTPPRLDSAEMKRKKGTRCAIPALGMNITCAAALMPSSSPSPGIAAAMRKT
ncbi:hypothetical protein U9M48_030472 [Paspalum notatum var. saurae]|uniref:Uncharacterized protein n=1 Tax=Paspalum notatum var. saurae TaxID=547442 RepID=A0AAQ3U0B7_PASNO